MSQATKIHSPVEVEKRKKLDIRAGDTVRVYIKIEEKGKIRSQIFEGIVLARKHGNEPGATLTVRRTSGGFGVEKVFPLFSPTIEKIEVVKRAKVRQANIYHIREKASKEVKRHIKNVRIVSESDEDQEGSEMVDEQEVEETSSNEEEDVPVEEGGQTEEEDQQEDQSKDEDEVKEEKISN
ncbi:MAG: 50S ribosomal protein L19 [Candidatus Paceibacterota bacterium]